MLKGMVDEVAIETGNGDRVKRTKKSMRKVVVVVEEEERIWIIVNL